MPKNLKDNPSVPPFRITYWMPSTEQWFTLEAFSKEHFLITCQLLLDIERWFRVETPSGKQFEIAGGTDFAILTSYLTRSIYP